MKIFAGYRPVEEPWGGANNFLRSLYQVLLEQHGVQVVFEPAPDCDLFFFNQTGKGPANNSAHYSVEDIEKIIAINHRAPVVMRMVNLRRHTSHKYPWTYWFNTLDRASDREVKRVAASCDHIIFQSKYQQDNFAADNVRPIFSTVIHNGAARIFLTSQHAVPRLMPAEKMRIFSSAVSTKGWKNHGLIAAAAKMPNVELFFAGTWPEGIPSAGINLLGRLNHQAILNIAGTCHYFLHPSLKEACSNSIVEALAMGLPVLYGTTGSSGEVVGTHGMAVREEGLADQFAQARILQPEFASTLAQQRHTYSMESAAAKYRQVFVECIERRKA